MNRLTKKDIEILKKIEITITTNTTDRLTVRAQYKVPNIFSHYENELETITIAQALTIIKSPTGNCQLASIKNFASHISRICQKYNKIQGYTDSQNEKLQVRMHYNRLATFKMFAYLALNYSKKLYFIDIRKYVIDNYKKVHPLIATRRNPHNEKMYISTNKHELMYSMIKLDKEKLKKYLT